MTEAGNYAIADFVCPTPETRAAFEANSLAFVVWLDRIKTGRFPDTNRLFVLLATFNIRVGAEGSPEYRAEQVAADLQPLLEPKRPTALFVGRYQPFHDGHQALIEEACAASARRAIPRA